MHRAPPRERLSWRRQILFTLHLHRGRTTHVVLKYANQPTLYQRLVSHEILGDRFEPPIEIRCYPVLRWQWDCVRSQSLKCSWAYNIWKRKYYQNERTVDPWETGTSSNIYLWRYAVSNLESISVCSTREHWKIPPELSLWFSSLEKVRNTIFLWL